MHTEVSIVIPAKNNQKQLDCCLKSILRSEINFIFEIIIVDDNKRSRTCYAMSN